MIAQLAGDRVDRDTDRDDQGMRTGTGKHRKEAAGK